jgi:hypothetical protein
MPIAMDYCGLTKKGILILSIYAFFVICVDAEMQETTRRGKEVALFERKTDELG